MDLEIKNISKFFGTFKAVDNVSFTADRGELFSLVGPSGCGKTTMLRIIAGFYTPEQGSIYLSGEDITRKSVNKRGAAMVFQNYALFPHMTVFENIAFGLKMAKVPKDEIKTRVMETLELIRLPDIAKKIPKELSGGMQQRVAIARAIVIHPRVLLLDEPLSNLDAKLREELRMEIREIQQSVGITTVFVTHDISEAFAMSDRIAVMQAGRIVQIADPVTIYEDPVNEFVGAFVGKANILKIPVKAIEHNVAYAEVAEGVTIAFRATRSPVKAGDLVHVMIRPERVALAPQRTEASNCLQVDISRAYYLGNKSYYEVMLGEQKLVVDMTNTQGNSVYSEEDHVYATWGLDDSIYFSA